MPRVRDVSEREVPLLESWRWRTIHRLDLSWRGEGPGPELVAARAGAGGRGRGTGVAAAGVAAAEDRVCTFGYP